MKKVLFLATLAVAFVLTSCNGVNSLPEKLRDPIKDMDKACKEYFQDEDDYEYKGVKVEDKNIVFTVKISKDELDGKTLKQWAKKKAKKDGFYNYDNMSKEEIAGYLCGKTFAGVDDDLDEEEVYPLLKKEKYNLVFRFVGKDSDDKVEIKVSHKDMPDYDKDED